MQRVGELQELAYVLICKNNNCIKDAVDHRGFMLTLLVNNELKRTDESVYLVLTKFNVNDKDTKLPIWRLIPIN